MITGCYLDPAQRMLNLVNLRWILVSTSCSCLHLPSGLHLPVMSRPSNYSQLDHRKNLKVFNTEFASYYLYTYIYIYIYTDTHTNINGNSITHIHAVRLSSCVLQSRSILNSVFIAWGIHYSVLLITHSLLYRSWRQLHHAHFPYCILAVVVMWHRLPHSTTCYFLLRFFPMLYLTPS
jgi:hypothetical protein